MQEWGYELSPQEREALRRRQIQEGRDKYGHEEALGTAMREYYDPNAEKAQEDARWANYIQQESANPLRQRPTDPAKAAAWEAYMGPMGDDGLGLTAEEKATLDIQPARHAVEAPKTEISTTAKKKEEKEDRREQAPQDNSRFGQGERFGSAIGSAFNALTGRGTSDKDAKGKPKAVEGSDMDAFMRKLEAEAFRYKDGVGEDPDRDFVGVMAQEVEKTPVGSTLVVEGEDGYKQLDVTHGFGTTLAALGRLAERLDKLEKGKGKKNG